MGKGRTGAIRQEALKGSDFVMAEKHGKRLDLMGPSRRVRDVKPLVYGSLDLAEARRAWMEGVQQQGETEALHMLVQFPTALKIDGPTPEETERKEQALLMHAVRFANAYHGGDAVFAARLDRDEQGRHTVDVFAMPRYDFTYKDGRKVKRAATSKFAKEQARARCRDLIQPGEKLQPDSPIMQGRALQAAWHEYLRDELGMGAALEPRNIKKVRTADRLEPEEYSLKVERERLAKERAEIDAKEKAVARDAAVVAGARRMSGLAVPPELQEVAGRGRRKRPEGLER